MGEQKTVGVCGGLHGLVDMQLLGWLNMFHCALV